ncbi:hypothetical protein ALC56_10185 [Trachymyrmex septentrionalis]|uniref:Uncharacterized protein n=1 Tax=Trachymyrmex septentrionalis TaxID=34720 RepID=A0A195F4W4_9HYME|nr:hypothetical protein ALC56_10185 [Trachymyrmex septentrionalis]
MKFEQLEALKSNNIALYSVNAVNKLRGKRLIVAMDFMHLYIINVRKNEVTGFIGDVWTIFEKTLRFKYTLFVQSESVLTQKWCYINIFSRSLWLACFISIICTASSIVGIYRIKKFVCIDYEKSDDELSSLSFNLFYILGFRDKFSACERKFERLIKYLGFQKIPRSLSLRLIILSSLVTGMLMIYVFSTPISCLANEGHSISLTNLKDMVKKRIHSLCIRNDSTAYCVLYGDKNRNKENIKIYKYDTKNGLPDSNLQDDWKGLLNCDYSDIRDSVNLALKLCRPGIAYLETPAVFLPIYHKIQHECNIVH